MDTLRFRQVHLDFHTGPHIPDVGSAFDRAAFGRALADGHVDSITLFAKCHHGYSYHPTEENEIHPSLSFDLLGEQLAVCREAGVRAPVYLSAGFDEKEAFRHPEWLYKHSFGQGHDFCTAAGYHLLCFNTPYLDLLVRQTEEVMRRYAPCELFFDIVGVRACRCNACVASMLQRGLDPNRPEDVLLFGEEVYQNYCDRLLAAVRTHRPDTALFHNAGNIERGRRDIAFRNTHHFELESLPTGGWGYDHFPMSASYVRTLGREYLGMTGKFHLTWGEFGGFKHPNALRYETALSLAFGAKCSVGDQLHPSGKINPATYRLIGQAYAEVEQKEPWCRDVSAVADIAVLSSQAMSGAKEGRDNAADTGACRILLEGKYLFDLIDAEEPLDKYRLLILPDRIRIDCALRDKIDAFLQRGGALLCTGESGLLRDREEFAFDLGAVFEGKSPFRPSYMRPRAEAGMTNGITEYVMYEDAFLLSLKATARPATDFVRPYFNRAPLRFSSHRHTPDQPGGRPGGALTERTAYLCWRVFEDYANTGSLHVKELVCQMIETLIGAEKTLRISALPDRGIATLMKQGNRYINHLLFAHTSLRGNRTEIIEDLVPLYDIDVKIKLPDPPARVYLAPENTELPYTYRDGTVCYRVKKLLCHQMIVIEQQTKETPL